jgi:hypothetical protein
MSHTNFAVIFELRSPVLSLHSVAEFSFVVAHLRITDRNGTHRPYHEWHLVLGKSLEDITFGFVPRFHASVVECHAVFAGGLGDDSADQMVSQSSRNDDKSP